MKLVTTLDDPVDVCLLDLLRPDAQRLAGGCALNTEEEWERLATKAADLAVGPLVYAVLRQREDRYTVPAAVLQGLRNHYLESALRNFALYRQLRTVLDRLQAQGIEVIVLKGAYLAQAVYRDAALRMMSDVDLLIHAEDRSRVHDLLAELGYRQESVKTDAPELLHHDLYTHPDQPVSFEIHWTLVSQGAPFQIDIAGLWARAETIRIAGVQTRTLSPVDLVLYLCIHMTFQHVCDHYCLRCLCDIQQVVEQRGAQLDWAIVSGRARAWGCERNAHLALLLAHDLLATAAPTAILESLRPAQFDDRLAQWAAQRVLGLVDDRAGPWSANLGRWHLTHGLADKARVALRICFPSGPELARRAGVPSGSWRVWLLYPYHWTRLVLRGIVLFLWPRRAADTPQAIGWTEREIGRLALARWTRRENGEDRV